MYALHIMYIDYYFQCVAREPISPSLSTHLIILLINILEVAYRPNIIHVQRTYTSKSTIILLKRLSIAEDDDNSKRIVI